MTIERTLTERADYLTASLNKLDAKYPNPPEESLYTRQVGEKTYYYCRFNKHLRYIKQTETALVQRLMQNKYVALLRMAIRKELSAIRAYFTGLPSIAAEEVYESFEPFRQFVDPEFESERQLLLRWNKREAEALAVNAALKTDYETVKGEMVRSKSEYMLANMLYKNGIPYIYELPLTLSSGRIVLPDFTILDVSHRREIILEHLGKMDDDHYLDKNLIKLKEYARSGYLLGDRLLITMESGALQLNIKMAEAMVLRALGIR